MNIDKKKMRKMFYIYIAIILALVFSSRTIYNFSLPRVTVIMPESGWITQELEVRGVIEFSETFDIFASSSGWIDEILVSPGDLINTSSVIASISPLSSTADQAILDLRTNIDRFNNQLAGLNLNRSNIQSSLRALDVESTDDLLDFEWAIEDAEDNLRMRKNALLEAQQLAEIALLEDFTYINATTETERTWNRQVTELREAEAELLVLETENNTFDDFIFQQNIVEASVALEREIINLQEAKSSLEAARDGAAASFDRHEYQNAINATRTTHERRISDYNDALMQLDIAWNHLNFLINIDAEPLEIEVAHTNINNLQRIVTQARQARDDANTSLNLAQQNMTRAENAFNEANSEQREQTIEAAEVRVTQAENAVSDATRAYENVINALDNALDRENNIAITTAQRRVDDALTALNESSWRAQQNLIETEEELANSYQSLARAKINLDLAQRALTSQMDDTRNDLELQLKRLELDIDQVSIDLRATRSSLAFISNHDSIDIISRHQGIVVDIGKISGQLISQGERIATMGVNNNNFILEFSSTISEAGFINIGDEANVYKSGSNAAIRAVVYDITLVGDNLTIRLFSETDQLHGGEFVRVRLNNRTGPHEMIVPNEAIFVGAMGQYYIWTLQSREGTLGIEYFSTRVNVRLIDSDDFNTAIYMGFMMRIPVITSYSRELSVNGRVSRLE